MNLYLDASALVKRYVREPGSDELREVMARADGWFMCRIGFLETARAVGLAAGNAALRTLRSEWPAFGVIEVNQRLVESATELALRHQMRSLDALHLASALLLPMDGLTIAVWDVRLHRAALAEGLEVMPNALG